MAAPGKGLSSLWASGATSAARKAFLDAAEVARNSGDAEVLAQAALGFVGRTDTTIGVNREAVGLLEEALEALAELDSSLRAELLVLKGRYGELWDLQQTQGQALDD